MLFDNYVPLAVKARPSKLEEYFGQEDLIGKNGPIRKIIELKEIKPMIFYGPPGSGKTSLGYLLKNYFKKMRFVYFSAASYGVPELRKKVNEALEYKKRGINTIIFVDEIHRFNKLQQDFLLPYVENADFILIGATTENPSFYINAALLSRCSIYIFKKLKDIDLIKMAESTIKKYYTKFNADTETLKTIVKYSNGDARRMLNILESVATNKEITKENLHKYISSFLTYDKSGNEHYNSISAFIKSMRAGEVDATVYYLARMLESGEDPRFIARRMVIFASEDIGLANSEALNIAVSTYMATERIGMPEIRLNISHCAIYLARSPKDRTAYTAYERASEVVKRFGNLPIPSKLVNQTNFNLNVNYDYEGFLPKDIKSYKFTEDKWKKST